MRVLIYEYKKSLRIIRKMKRELHASTSADDVKAINDMISHLEYVIEWLEGGREPGKRRGYDRVDVYTTDPMLMDQVQLQILGESKEGSITSEERTRINKALCTLSDREREVYILHHAELLSYEEIADLLGVTKSTVQMNMRRSENKIRKEASGYELCAAHS